MSVQLPEFEISPDVAARVDLNLSQFGRLREAANLRFATQLPDELRNWCLIYEEMLRRIFRECQSFRDTIFTRDGNIVLNAIDEFTSRKIAQFLSSPSDSNLKWLFDLLRHFRGSPDIIALVVCRNKGIECHRLVPDSQLLAFCEEREKELFEPMRMPTVESRKRLSGLNSAYYVVLNFPRPILLFGQASPYTPAVVRDFLGDKAATSKLLATMGYKVPDHALILSDTDLRHMNVSGGQVILKPLNDSNRVGVVGPIQLVDLKALRVGFEQCMSQVSNGPRQVLCEQYIQGTHFRINLNHDKVTFVAKSVPSIVEGDGGSSVRQLLAAKRDANKCKFVVADSYIENLLIGQHFSFDSIPDHGQRVLLSHDGNEEGYFEDETDDFPEQHKHTAINLGRDLRCPVLGLDVILDPSGAMWIVDVNSNPGIDFFGSPKRAYETMAHMIDHIVALEGKSVTRTKDKSFLAPT